MIHAAGGLMLTLRVQSKGSWWMLLGTLVACPGQRSCGYFRHTRRLWERMMHGSIYGWDERVDRSIYIWLYMIIYIYDYIWLYIYDYIYMLYVNRLPALGGHLWRIVNDRARKTRSRGNPQSKEHHVILKIVWFGIVLKCTPALRERSGPWPRWFVYQQFDELQN